MKVDQVKIVSRDHIIARPTDARNVENPEFNN
jgi:hypothetical protein